MSGNKTEKRLKMRIVKFELNDQAETLFNTLVKSPDFFGDTPRTLFVKLMMRAASEALPKEKTTIMPDTRTPREKLREENQARLLAYFRSTGNWPTHAGSINGKALWNMPLLDEGGSVTRMVMMEFTPPPDYPGKPHPGAAPVDPDDMPSEGDFFDAEMNFDQAGYDAAYEAWRVNATKHLS